MSCRTAEVVDLPADETAECDPYSWHDFYGRPTTCAQAEQLVEYQRAIDEAIERRGGQ